MQQAQRGTAPVAQSVFQALHQSAGPKHAAVEQQGVGHGLAVVTQKVGNVAGDGRVAGVGQAKRHDAAAPFLRRLTHRHAREKSVHQQRHHLVARERHRAAAANQAGPAAEQSDLGLIRGIGRQQQLFGGAAAFHQLGQSAGRKLGRALVVGRGGHAGFDRVGQCQIHVVAAQHQVLADADAGQLRLALLQAHVDQAEVGGATAHIADQHPLCVFQLGREAAAVA